MVSGGICHVLFLTADNLISILICNPQQYVQAPEARPVADERFPASQQDRKDIATQTVRSGQPKDLSPPPSTSPLSPPMSDRNADPALDVGPGVEVPYNIDWIFPRLRNPTRFWYVASQFVISAVGIFSKIVLSEYLSAEPTLPNIWPKGTFIFGQAIRSESSRP